MPRHIDSSVIRISSVTSGPTSPTATVIAASPCHPSTIAPQSIEMMSPDASTRPPGMPCTTSSLTEAQMVPGNGGWPYPWNEGVPPADRMFSSAMASSSAVEIPARTDERSSSRVCPTSSPATRMLAICSDVLYSMPRSRPVLRRPAKGRREPNTTAQLS